MKQGMIYVFTGDGKGKTSAALGTVMRAVGNGMRVAWVSWYKSENWKLSELVSLKKLRVETYLLGRGFSMDEKQKSLIDGSRVVDRSSEKGHRTAAQEALKKTEELMGKVDVLVLDEINNAVDEGLVDLSDLVELISNRGKAHLILTGRNADQEIIDLADLTTEMKKIKHPYDEGKLAVKGLDY